MGCRCSVMGESGEVVKPTPTGRAHHGSPPTYGIFLSAIFSPYDLFLNVFLSAFRIVI